MNFHFATRPLLVLVCSATVVPLAAATVQYDIADPEGRDLPAKITFLGLDGKVPKMDLKSRLPERAARKNVAHVLFGRGELPVPPGKYRAYVSHGIEWSCAVVDLDVKPERPAILRAVLERCVDTSGWLSADLHLHTRTFSGHGDANVEERIVTLCSEGIEWAVATDHNHVTDYRDYVRRLGAERWLITSCGNEVSTGIGHFNTFPIDPKSKPVDHSPKDPRVLFKKIRENPLDEVLQVNHPRYTGSAGSYFRAIDLSPVTGDPADPQFSGDFDSLEVLNDNSLGGWELIPGRTQDFYSSVRDDWFNLLNRGLTYTAAGNSDSHDVNGVLPGSPRNFIASGTDDPASAREADLVRAVREHRTVVSSGIFVTMTAAGRPVGSTVRCSGEVALAIKVQAAPWIDARTLVVVGNGEEVFRADLLRGPARKLVEDRSAAFEEALAAEAPAKSAGEARKAPARGGRRRGARKDEKKDEAKPETIIIPNHPVIRFQDTVRLKPAGDTWYVAYAIGPDAPYPMLRKTTFPLGFTNPIWIDSDGDGKFTPLRETALRLVKEGVKAGDLTAKISDRGSVFRRQALGAVGSFPPEERIAPLSAFLEDKNPKVREGAVMSLAATGGKKAREVLSGAFAKAKDPWERFVIGREIVRSGDLSALGDLRGIYAASKDAEMLRMRTDLKGLCKNPMNRWWTIGPFPAKKVDEGLAAVFPPEPDASSPPKIEVYGRKYTGFEGKTVEWKRVAADAGQSVSFSSLKPNEGAIAYAHVIVRAKAPFETCFLLGAKCGLDISLNGESIHRQKSSAHGSVGSQVVPVKFRKGANALLIKAVVEKGDFAFSLMTIDPAGELQFEAPKIPDKPAKKVKKL